MPAGARLAIALPEPAIVRWGKDGWAEAQDAMTSDSGLGFHVAALPNIEITAATAIDFTWRDQDRNEWHGRDYRVKVTGT